MNPNLSSAQFKSMARDAYGKAREHRLAGDLNAADEALRHGAVYRDAAQYGVRANGSIKHPSPVGYNTTWRYGDTPKARVLP